MILKHKIVQAITVAACLILAALATIQAEEHAGKDAENKPNTTASSFNWEQWGQMSPAMQKSMDPKVMTEFMAMMMQPEKLMTMESCALCHEGQDVARYQKDFGPMMDAMKPMMAMMNPMMGMMTPMMAPMVGMVNPTMAMMNPMLAPTMGMMSPMMNPMMDMSGAMMSPMMGMMNPMMTPMMGMMDPKQYEQWFNQMNPNQSEQ